MHYDSVGKRSMCGHILLVHLSVTLVLFVKMAYNQFLAVSPNQTWWEYPDWVTLKWEGKPRWGIKNLEVATITRHGYLRLLIESHIWPIKKTAVTIAAFSDFGNLEIFGRIHFQMIKTIAQWLLFSASMQNDVSSGVVSVCPSYMWQCVKKCETDKKKLRLCSASATLHYKVPGLGHTKWYGLSCSLCQWRLNFLCFLEVNK